MPVQAPDSPQPCALFVLTGLEGADSGKRCGSNTQRLDSRSVPRDREGSHQGTGGGDGALGPDGRYRVGLGVSHPQPE